MLPKDRKRIERLKRVNSILIIIIIFLTYLYINKCEDVKYSSYESKMEMETLSEKEKECDSLKNYINNLNKLKEIPNIKKIDKPKIINKTKVSVKKDNNVIIIDTTKKISIIDSLKN